jgi:hypothetical protein
MQVACQRGHRERFTTAAALVSELIEARDEKHLLRFQKQLAAYELLIVDELGFVPLSKTGAELLFEIFSQRYEVRIVVAAHIGWPALPDSVADTGTGVDAILLCPLRGDGYLFTVLCVVARGAASSNSLPQRAQSSIACMLG